MNYGRNFAVVCLMFAAASLTSAQTELGRELVEADRLFASQAAELGMKEAFLAFLADDAVIFQPGPVNGKAVWRSREESTEQLSWYPTLVCVAASGELGCTSGPWVYTPEAHLDQPPRYGHYVSMWRRQRDGSWKVVAGIGVKHDFAGAVDSSLQVVPSVGAAQPRKSRLMRQRLLEAERRLSQHSARDGLGAAVASMLAEEGKVFFEGMMPLSRQQMRKGLPEANKRVSFQVAFSSVSNAGDLAYTYGGIVSASSKNRKGYFLRVWQSDKQGRWRIVLNVITSSDG